MNTNELTCPNCGINISHVDAELVAETTINYTCPGCDNTQSLDIDSHINAVR